MFCGYNEGMRDSVTHGKELSKNGVVPGGAVMVAHLEAELAASQKGPVSDKKTQEKENLVGDQGIG